MADGKTTETTEEIGPSYRDHLRPALRRAQTSRVNIGITQCKEDSTMITHEEKCRLLAGSILPFGKAEATELPDGSKALVGESTRWVLAKSATWEGLASEAYKVHELLRAVSLERDRNIVIVAGIDVGYVESWLEENVSEDVVPASARRIVAGTWMEEHGEDLVPPEYEAELEEATRDRAFELLEETDTPEWEDLASTDEEL